MIIALGMTLLYGRIRLRFLKYFSKSTNFPLGYSILIAVLGGCMITTIVLSTPGIISWVSVSIVSSPNPQHLTNNGYIQYITIGVLMTYALVWIGGYALIPRSNASISIGTSIGYTIVLLLSWMIWSMISPVRSLLTFLVVSSEEFLKIAMALLRYHRQNTRSNDLIMMGIIAGLGFGIVENARYIIQQVQTSSTMQLVSLSSIRSISSSMIHICCTGGIARIIARQYHRSRIGIYAAGAVIFFSGYHLAYNLSLEYIAMLTPILILGGYILLSRYVYDSDLLYV